MTHALLFVALVLIQTQIKLFQYMPFYHPYKGVYKYEYTNGWDKLDDMSLPLKGDFYYILKKKCIKGSN